jgi:flagellar biosynthesis component FlhA
MLRALLAERAPISDFDGLCERFLKLSVRNRPLVVAELMRRSRGVRERLWGNSKSFTLLPLGPKFTRLISGSLLGSGVWQVLALEPQKCQEALSAVREATTDILLPAIVIDEPALRIHVRKLIEVEFPDIPVLARREMLKGLMVDGKKMVEL